MQDFEKLGQFYLGREYDVGRREVTPRDLLYDSKDLTTHAVCVGMTGSGKTGLGIALLEEAAIDGIPAIAIDPKGDLGNLLLDLPRAAARGLPAVGRPRRGEPQGAHPRGVRREDGGDLARGPGRLGRGRARIARYRDAVDLAIYTPGSSAGLPLTVLRSFAAPPPGLADQPEAYRQRIASAVSGLLALLGVNADPMASREHILLSNILDHAWRAGHDLDMAGLIHAVQSPPFQKVGVIDLETFFPAKDRFALAMKLNNLLASPGFAAWLEGEPMDVGGLLSTRAGKPRLSIISIAHLSDAERMFFVTILLNEVLAWARSQPGTSSLRRPVHGRDLRLLPRHGEPAVEAADADPAQAGARLRPGCRAGDAEPGGPRLQGALQRGHVVHRPVADPARQGPGARRAGGGLDVRGPRLRPAADGPPALGAGAAGLRDERRARGAAGGLPDAMDAFVPARPDDPRADPVADGGPQAGDGRGVAFVAGGGSSRWGRLGGGAPKASPSSSTAALAAAGSRPVVPPDVPVFFVPRRGRVEPGESILYRPSILGVARLHYADKKAGVNHWETLALLQPIGEAMPAEPWAEGVPFDDGVPELDRAPEAGARFATLPPELARAKCYAEWTKSLKNYLYRERTLDLWECPEVKAISRPSEAEREFRLRVVQVSREERDREVEKLRAKYAPKRSALEDQMRRARERLEREQAEASRSTWDATIALGNTVLGSLFGRKAISKTNVGRAASAARAAGRAMQQRGDIGRAGESLEALQSKYAKLEAEFQQEVGRIAAPLRPEAVALERLPIRPRKADITVEQVVLAWTPWKVGADGEARAGVSRLKRGLAAWFGPTR